MIQQDITQGDKTTTYKDLKQLKIYTGTHFMYTQINPGDSTVSFGVGSYTTDKDTLREHSIYSSHDSTFENQPRDYNLVIKITPEAYNQAAGYNQTIKDFMIDGKKSTLLEIYSRVKDTLTSPLDGVWKEVKSFMVVDNDTLPNDRTQYKAYFRGYFMFGNTVRIGPSKTTSGMGYGTYKLINDKEIEETDLNSSYPFVAGNTFTVSIDMPDSDHYSQTIKNADGSIGVEYYERLK